MQAVFTFLLDVAAGFVAGIVVHKLFANQEKQLMKQAISEKVR